MTKKTRKNYTAEFKREAVRLVTDKGYKTNDEAYGSRRMSEELRVDGEDVGRYQAGTLMKKANIEVKQKKRFRVTTDSKHNYPVAPNLPDRQFDVEAPNTVCKKGAGYIF